MLITLSNTSPGEAIDKSIEYLTKNNPIYRNVNVGTGIGTTVLELIKVFERVNNIKVPYTFKNRRLGDVAHIVADNSFLLSEFKIIPKRSIEDMCKDGWKWKKLKVLPFIDQTFYLLNSKISLKL